jgi:hypothetical protein
MIKKIAIAIINLAWKWLQTEDAQKMLIQKAKELAKKTENKTDDEVVSWFESLWNSSK